MAFDANRDIKVEASESSPGRYVLRTRGLADRRRPELELAGVPEAGLNAAAGVINLVAEYTVNNAEVLADQSVGNVLTVGDDARKLLLAVRAVLSEKPKGGLWSKIAGGGKGVLRLVDVDAKSGELGAPRTALATMLVHRAAVRLAKDDDEGARAELLTAIEVLPGEPGAGAAPSIGGADGELNWQNHLAYLDLARLAASGGDEEEAQTCFASALARSDELATKELGGSLAALAALAPAAVEAAARRIVEHNLAALHRAAGPTGDLVTVASPIWELEGGSAQRRASLMPAALLSLYYEGDAAAGLRRAGPELVTKILAASPAAPWRAAWTARATRIAWISEEAPFAESVGPVDPMHGLVSSVLADVARGYRAGLTDDEILLRYGALAEAESLRDSLEEKLGRLAIWESEQYFAAMSV